jgi:hypothetical protein
MTLNPLNLCIEIFANNVAIRKKISPASIKSKLYNSEKVKDFYLKNQEDFDELAIFFESKNIDYVDYIECISKKVGKEIYQPLYFILNENYNEYLTHIEETKIVLFRCEFFKSLRFFVDKCKNIGFKSFQEYTDSEVVLGVSPFPKCFKDIMHGNISKQFFVTIPGVQHYIKCWSQDLIQELGMDGFDYDHLNKIGLSIIVNKFETYDNFIKCVSDMLVK